MRESIQAKITKFKLWWKHYVFQSLFATLAIFIVLVLLRLHNAVIIASVGASAFIIFAMPNYITAKPWNVIGGHVVGLLSGSLFALIPHSALLSSAIIYALAVGLAIFVMVVIDTEHPPAAGTALGTAIAGFSLNVAIAVIVSAILLSLAHHFLKRSLKDLT